ncbi:MAG TPA: hypothetical protein VMU69_18510 [Bradyrhizobium sp.]|nr:hypothetical protein [Bradyrhizobium sp.]
MIFSGLLLRRNIERRLDAILQQAASVVPRPIVAIAFEIALPVLPLDPAEEALERATAEQQRDIHRDLSTANIDCAKASKQRAGSFLRFATPSKLGSRCIVYGEIPFIKDGGPR